MDFNVIWLCGMPRSGTSWLSQIFDSHPGARFRLNPLYSYTFKNRLTESSSRVEWISFFEELYAYTGDSYLEQLDRRKAGQYPYFKEKDGRSRFLVIKETRFHNLMSSILSMLPEVKVVYIVRNPCAAIYSWISAPREFPPSDDPVFYWYYGQNRKSAPEEFWGFKDWMDLTRAYHRWSNEYPDRIYIQRYEELVTCPLVETQRMFEFMELGKVPIQTRRFLQESQSRHSDSEYAVFKNKFKVLHNWRYKLNIEIQRRIENELMNTDLEKYLKE